MEDPDTIIYTMISFLYKLDDGKGVFPDVLIHNMKTITGIEITEKKELKDFLKKDILTIGHDEDNRETVLLSSGAQRYLDNIDKAWLKFPEMRAAFKDMSKEIDTPYSHRRSSKKTKKEEGNTKLKNLDDPIAKLLLKDDIIYEKNKFINNYMHYLDKEIITSSDILNININITNLDDGSCPICEDLYEKLKDDNIKWHTEHKHFLNLLSEDRYVFHEKNKQYYLKTIKDSSGQRTVLVEVGNGEVQFPKKTSIRRSYHLYRGENFWENAADFLKENNIYFADLDITNKDLQEIRQYFPEFNINQSKQRACPIGLDKEKCEAAWKETESIIYQKQKDIPGAKLLLSKIYPEIVVKPKENDLIHIDKETFDDIYSLLQEDIFDKKYKRSTALENSWYDYIYMKEDKDGIYIDVPAFIKDNEESGININDIEIHLIKKKIEPLYQQICGSGKKN